MLASPVTAQRDKFGEIECTKLTVVDADGRKRVILTFDEHGGAVVAFGKDGESQAGLRGYDDGSVGVYGKDGNCRWFSLSMNAAGVSK